MSEPHLPHPELINGPNPLLEAAAPYVTFAKLPAALKREPLKTIDWRSMPSEYRSSILNQVAQHYCPNKLILDLADSIQTMLRGGLMARNPLSIAEQRRINAVALTDSVKNVPLQSLRTRAGGGIISAITGMGKSAVLERTLGAIAPDQVVVHSKSEACGWSSLTQVLYLVIDTPFNGTPRGLLSRIVEGLDRLLGTDYSETIRRHRNLDVSLLFVTKLLSNHRVGMLAIDENQQDNFDGSIWQRSFVLFFLGLMNLGVPVLLLGNPQAFVGLQSASQIMRRFSETGYYKLMPATSTSVPWWARDYVPEMCKFSLCEEIPPIAEIVEKTFEMTAGVPGLFGPIWIEAQRIALRRGGHQTSLTLSDILAAGSTPRAKELVEIASQISGKTTHQRFTDIPAKVDAGEASSKTQSGTADGTSDKSISDKAAKPRDEIAAVRGQLERKMRAKELVAEKRKNKADQLSPEDKSAYELQMEMFAGLEGMQAPLLSGASRAPPKQR